MLGRVVVMVMVMVSFASDDELYLGHARRHRVEHVAALRQRQLCTPAATTYRPSLQNKLAATQDRSHTDRVTILANPSPNHWLCPVTLTFNLRRAMVMSHDPHTCNNKVIVDIRLRSLYGTYCSLVDQSEHTLRCQSNPRCHTESLFNLLASPMPGHYVQR